jgi:hypothetical protein
MKKLKKKNNNNNRISSTNYNYVKFEFLSIPMNGNRIKHSNYNSWVGGAQKKGLFSDKNYFQTLKQIIIGRVVIGFICKL